MLSVCHPAELVQIMVVYEDTCHMIDFCHDSLLNAALVVPEEQDLVLDVPFALQEHRRQFPCGRCSLFLFSPLSLRVDIVALSFVYHAVEVFVIAH